MDNKTLNYLNSKMWYRLIKVIFLGVFVLVEIVSVFAVYDENRTVQTETQVVTCNYGNKNMFVPQMKGIYISDYDLRNGISSIPDYGKEQIRQACGVSQIEIQKLITDTLNNSNTPALFSVGKGTTTHGSTPRAIVYSLLDILVIALVFEVVRRAFYYIVLGSLRPQKIGNKPKVEKVFNNTENKQPQENKPKEKFKMTFANSWWQWIVALVVMVPIRGILAFISLLIVSLFNLPDSESLGKDLASIVNIASLLIAIWMAFKLSRQTWEKKQKKLLNSLK